jgi:iron(III) transport system permease protein
VLFWALLPQITVVLSSFVERWSSSRLPLVVGIGNFERILTRLNQPVINSLVLAGLATAVSVAFGTATAYYVARRRFFGRWALDLTIMLPFVLPGLVVGVAYLVGFNDGWIVLTGTATILVLAYFTRRVAYVFRSVQAAIGQVDNKLEEASTICGADWLATMRRVVIPLIAPGILAGAILVFATLIGEISVTVLLFSAKWKTISIAIYEYVLSDELHNASAMGTVAIVLTLILVLGASQLVGRKMAEMFRSWG